MDFHEYNKGKGPSFESSNLTNSSNYSSKLSGIVEQVHSLNTLHTLAAFCQIVLGGAVVLISLLGLIRPLWVSTILSMFASVTVMLGIYFLYTSVTKVRNPDKLLGNAIRRVIDAQN